jgi:protein O-GlcNAc transferase
MPAIPVDLPRPMSRNAPCPCGSGQRYKECHGRLAGGDAGTQGALPADGAQSAQAPERLPSLNARDAEAVQILNDRGTLLQSERRFVEALQCFDAALALAPDYPGILRNRGNALMDLRRHEDAVHCFARLVEVAPDHPWALGNLYHTQTLCCDWTSIDVIADRIQSAVRAGKVAIVPFIHLTLSDSPADQLRSARIEAAVHAKPALPPPLRGIRYGHQRIRIAYLSADFRQHPVPQLAVHLFETHDRTRFEVTAISFGADTGDPMRRRLERAFDHFLDVRERGDVDVARLMREREIDIAVDLMGYTNNARPGILAYRAAPVQVGYLGYPGTLGSARIDYIVADRHVVPRGEEEHYAERVVRLPDTYFVHDPAQHIGERPTRTEAGLPEGAFVFCCFNNNYKIMPATFGAWMRILANVDHAVLWLLVPGGIAQRNLRREAAARGVDPARLIFASRVPPEVHLARQQLADLFLDTHHYNAHTTAVDALWVGLPLLTYPGSTIAGRVATGLLHAVGMPELVARDLADYEVRAVELARAPAMLRALREQLARNRSTFPLFDPVRYRVALEAAYTTMWTRSEAGLDAEAFDVAPSGAVVLRQ